MLPFHSRAVLILLGMSMAARAAAQTVGDPTLQLTTVTSGLSAPTSMAFLAPGDILVTQKNDGRVLRIVGGVVQPTPVLDIAVNNDSERGLLGIAIDTETPARVFLYVTEVSDPNADGLPDSGTPLGNRVYRYTWNAASGHLESPQLVLDLPVLAGPNHNGGKLVLGPTPTPGPNPPPGDGSPLYAVIGDLNHNGQLENNATGAAPDDTAVILRVAQDGTPWPGNPFMPYCSTSTTQACPSGTGCPVGESCVTRVARYFAYGVRNSFGLAIDSQTGALWDTENGPSSYDEINLVAPGFNSGWVPLMGPDARNATGVGDLFAMPGGASTYSDPEFSWLTPIAVTGIVFPRDGALGAAYDHVALVADFNLGNIYRLQLTPARTGFDFDAVAGLADRVADSAAERDLLRLGSGFGGISALERGPDGGVYVLSYGQGTIYRIGAVNPPTPTATATATPTPFAVSGQVRYYFAGRPVGGVTVDAAGSGSLSTSTDATSAYTLAPLPSGDWSITPKKSGGVNNGISALDGAHVLQRVAGLRVLTPQQLQACDVTGDGTCSALDGTRILQYVAGIMPHFDAATACGSDWLFVPIASPVPNQSITTPQLTAGTCVHGQISYQPLVNSAAGQDFLAILLGDVTGNWAP